MNEMSARLTTGQAEYSEGPSTSDATRYLAAAAYRDTGFRRKVLDLLRHGWYRARAPEFGIDDNFIARHCRRAEHQQRVRDLLMIAAFVAISHEPLLWVYDRPDALVEILSSYSSTFLLAATAVVLVLFAERLLTEHFIVARSFNQAAFSANGAGGATSPQNVVVYGGYSPFVGSGYGIGGWSFSVNLERTREELGETHPLIPFTTWDLQGFVCSRLDRLHIPGLSHRAVLFADGRRVRDSAELFTNNRVASQFDPGLFMQREDWPDPGTRTYLCISVADWSGEIVLSIYLRFRQGELNLFAEAAYYLLTPPKRSFLTVDEADPRLKIGVVARLLSRATVTAPIMLAGAALNTAAWVLSPLVYWLERRRIRRTMRRNRQFNVGAVTSIRELGMENYFRVYFQQLDKERHGKTIEQCVIDAIVEFLTAHNVDTSDIRDRRSTILNNGVIVSGGNINAESLAVGSGARAMLSRLRSKAPGQAAGTSHAAAPAS